MIVLVLRAVVLKVQEWSTCERVFWGK